MVSVLPYLYMKAPKTLLQAIQYFSDHENCRKFMIAQRWPDGVVHCPVCDSDHVTYLEAARLYKCYGKHPKAKFSLKVGTVFEDSPIGLEKWLPASWLLSNCKNGISSYELGKAIGVTQKSAWFMLHRIRAAMKDANPGMLGGGNDNPVEVDEVYIGAQLKNMHAKRRLKLKIGMYAKDDKAIVMGMLARGTREVRAKVIPNAKRETLQKEIMEGIGIGSTVYTDGYAGYDHLKRAQFVHETVNHLKEYVRGTVHTQGLDNFWSLLKRSLSGTYVAVEPYHLHRYVDEQVFRYNNRRGKADGDRVCKSLIADRGEAADLCGGHWQGGTNGELVIH